MNYSEQLTKAFNDASVNSVEKDINRIEKEFQNVLNSPLDYCTFKVTKKPEYHNGYHYDYEYYIQGIKLVYIACIRKLGIYTAFWVHSTSNNKTKHEVRQILKDRYCIEFQDIATKLPKDMYLVYVKHNEK